MENLLVYLVCKYHGDYTKITRAIINNETASQKAIQTCISSLNCKYVTILSDDYPPSLRELKEPPYVLFYKGDLRLAFKKCMGMVGMREPSRYGQKMAAYFAKELSDDFVIVSGLAKGIDGIAHANAKKTIAVLGCGVNICYPKSNLDLYNNITKYGLILSEFPPNEAPRRYYFPWRNRIVAGLSEALIVVEAKRKSGTMITVSHALELGKSVFAIPCRIGDHEGTLALLQDGAIPLISVQDIYENINLRDFNTK